MKLTAAAKKLGLLPKTVDEVEVPILDLLSADEFNRPGGGSETRNRAVERAVEAELEFASNFNLHYEVAKKLLRAQCPKCHGLMMVKQGGGSSGECNVTFEHVANPDCKVKVYLQTPENGLGISFK